jgi:hypothetical protein
MKKRWSLFVMFGVSSSVFAEDVKFVNADASIYSEVCIAAATSEAALAQKAAQYKISAEALDKFTCNNLSLEQFARKYQGDGEGKDQTIQVFAFEKSGDVNDAEVCIAAATSNDAFIALRSKMNKPDRYFLDVHCNDIPLTRFARKFGNKEFSVEVK